MLLDVNGAQDNGGMRDEVLISLGEPTPPQRLDVFQGLEEGEGNDDGGQGG